MFKNLKIANSRQSFMVYGIYELVLSTARSLICMQTNSIFPRMKIVCIPNEVRVVREIISILKKR